MNKGSITLSYKQIGLIALVIVNIILVGPGGWILKELWSEAKTFKTETEEQIDELKNQLSELEVDLTAKCVTRKSFADYREEMGENIRHLDSKITP